MVLVSAFVLELEVEELRSPGVLGVLLFGAYGETFVQVARPYFGSVCVMYRVFLALDCS